MEKAYFPLFVDISDKKIVVVGGGQIASRRVKTLTSFAENITVIAPEISVMMGKLEQAGKILLKRREYRIGDIDKADIVLAATDKKELNYKIAMECRAIEQDNGRRILLNVVDDRRLCSFYFPAVVQREEIVIGINSGGNNPGKVKDLRKKLEGQLGE